MRKVRTHTFNKVHYRIELTPIDGWCDNPKNPFKCEYPAIRVIDGLPFENERNAKLGLRVLIHECLHAEDYNKHEKTVDRISKEIANLLWRLGYRRIENATRR